MCKSFKYTHLQKHIIITVFRAFNITAYQAQNNSFGNEIKNYTNDSQNDEINTKRYIVSRAFGKTLCNEPVKCPVLK